MRYIWKYLPALIVLFLLVMSLQAVAKDLIEPPPGASSDFNTFKKQFITHNTNNIINKIREQDKKLNSVITTVEKTANMDTEIIVTKDFEFNTGAKIDKAMIFMEARFFQPRLRSEINFIHKETSVKLYKGTAGFEFKQNFAMQREIRMFLSQEFD